MSALLVTFVVANAYLNADDLRKRKPLPSFLRSPKLAERYLSTRDIDELMAFELKEPVCLQLLQRDAVPKHARAEALIALGKLRETDPVDVLLPIIANLSEKLSEEGVRSIVSLLPEQKPADLKEHRDAIVEIAVSDQPSSAISAALTALTIADGSADESWRLTKQDENRQLAFIDGLRWLPSGGPLQSVYEVIWPLTTSEKPPEVQEAAIRAVGRLNIQPQTTFNTLVDNIRSGNQTAASIAAICDISSQHWDPEQRQPLAEAVLRHLAGTELAARTTPDGKLSAKLVKALSEKLPTDVAARLTKELDRLGVRELQIVTLEEQMAYDQTVLVVAAGQGLQITFHNDDIMPHNFVIVDSAEARVDIGIAADQMQNEPDALAKGYLPDSDQILHASKMLQPGKTQVMTFEAPKTAGTYSYLCTFPGHWSKMYGALIVVDDVDAFLAANSPLPTRDKLLGIESVEWTLDQLTPHLAKYESGRSFEAGKKNFLKSSCLSCHAIDGKGGRIGPELTKISETYKTPEELLKHILEPTLKVEEKYAVAIIETDDGRVLRGTVVEETESVVKLAENPLDTCNLITIEKDTIEDLTRSKLSPMPAGLLNTIVTPEGVMDLLAYLMSGANPDADCFEN